MKKVRAAIVGYGNIGHYVLEALQAAPDFEIAGVVRRAGAENCPAELSAYPVVKNIKELKDVDVAILCTPTRKVEEYAKEILALGIHTVDSFDIHTGITALRRTLDAEAKKHNTVSIISAGWDPGSVVRRAGAENCPAELSAYPVVKNIKELKDVDVAILCTPTRKVEEYAKEILALGIHTVDSFDIHTGITALRRTLDAEAKKHNTVSIISAGWDPGSDSIVRTMLEAIAPKGITYTNFGPGMSMGHTVAVKAIEGVKAALSMTIPTGTGIHRRMVYIELKDGYEFDKVAAAIKADPYFVNDETHVKLVPSVDALLDMGHGVNLTRKGVSGKTQNQLFEFNMRINNPALTAQVLVCVARAAMRQQPGCYTMVEVPVIDLLPGDREEWIGHLV